MVVTRFCLACLSLKVNTEEAAKREYDSQPRKIGSPPRSPFEHWFTDQRPTIIQRESAIIGKTCNAILWIVAAITIAGWIFLLAVS